MLPSDIPLCKISIHAPREGSDEQRRRMRRGQIISIHAPREGSDADDKAMLDKGLSISIHAPREGSDAKSSVPMVDIH